MALSAQPLSSHSVRPASLCATPPFPLPPPIFSGPVSVSRRGFLSHLLKILFNYVEFEVCVAVWMASFVP